MVHSGLKDCFIVALGSFNPDWNQQNVKKWVAEASGKVEPRVTENTTHLVTTSKEWEKKGPVVQDALKLKTAGQNLHIVSYDWLEDSLQSKSKRNEKKYKFSSEEARKEGEAGAGGAEPRTNAGMMKQLYEESTELTPAHKKNLEQQQAAAEQLAREKEAEKMKEFQQQRMTLPEQAAIFKKGAQKAKMFLLSDNHHIYTDSTGFTYDITLTKVDTKRNTNERYELVLKIFESNVQPPTYAFCTQFSGTNIQPQTNTVISLGSNWLTTFRAFKVAFNEKTGIEWDERVRVAGKRHANDKAAKSQSNMGGTYAGAQLGVASKTVDKLNRAPFQYHPPNYGPRGEFEDQSHLKKKTANEQQQQPSPRSENGAAATPGGLQDEFMMSGANGDTPRQTRSNTPVDMSAFGPKDAEKFKAAVEPKNPDGTDNLEPLDPLGLPFDYGKDFDFADFNGELGGFEFDQAATGDFGVSGETSAQENGNGGIGGIGAESGAEGSQHVNDDQEHLADGSQTGENLYEPPLRETQQEDPVEAADASENADHASLKLGGSMLGKRKADPIDSLNGKKHKGGAAISTPEDDTEPLRRVTDMNDGQEYIMSGRSGDVDTGSTYHG